MKISLLYCAAFLVTCSRVFGDFPTEDQVQRQLKPGMTPEQVIALFGMPGTGGPVDSDRERMFTYLCAVGRRTREVEGYVGFKVKFVDNKLTGWKPIRTNPSYDPNLNARENLRPLVWWLGLVFAGTQIYGAVRAFRAGASEYRKLLDTYAARKIPTEHLPLDFRFITHNTTLQEVTDRVGPCSRVLKLAVNRSTIAGYATVPTNSGTPGIVTVEYDLPYRAAVILMPKSSSQPNNRIRAAYYRPPRPDEE